MQSIDGSSFSSFDIYPIETCIDYNLGKNKISLAGISAAVAPCELELFGNKAYSANNEKGITVVDIDTGSYSSFGSGYDGLGAIEFLVQHFIQPKEFILFENPRAPELLIHDPGI